MDNQSLYKTTIDALEEIKGIDIRTLDVTDKTSVTDRMVIVTGNTSRQVKALAQNLIEKAKLAGYPPVGTEGEEHGEWVLVDLGDVVVHVMQPDVRAFYNLEKLWGDDSPVAISESP